MHRICNEQFPRGMRAMARSESRPPWPAGSRWTREGAGVPGGGRAGGDVRAGGSGRGRSMDRKSLDGQTPRGRSYNAASASTRDGPPGRPKGNDVTPSMIHQPSALRPRTVVTLLLAVLALVALALVNDRTAADPAPASSSAKPKPESPLCGSPSDHKGCPAGEDEGADAAHPASAAALVPAGAGAEVHDLPAGTPWRIHRDPTPPPTRPVPLPS